MAVRFHVARMMRAKEGGPSFSQSNLAFIDPAVYVPASLRMYSMVNQVMQTASTMARWALSVASPVSSSTPCRSGSVFSVIPIVDVMMKVIEIRLTI